MTWLDDATVEGRNLRAVLGPAVQTARLTRSLTEASTVELGVLDPSRELLRSDLWRIRASLVADGRRYVLKRRRKTRYTFDLTFEDIIAYTLKAVTKQRVAARNKQSRIEFVIRAITATGIKAYAPTAATAIGENSAQFTPATGADRRNAPSQGAPQNGGFIEGATVTVTNHGQPDAGRKPWTPANGEQLRSLVIAFDTATAICKRLKLTAEQTQLAEVAMVAAGSAESGWYKAAHNDVQGGHSGIYQQSPRYYTGPSDVAISTQEFLLGASTYGKPAQYFAYAGSMIALLQGFTGQATTLGAVIASRQGSDQGASYYDDFVPEARQTVSLWQANASSAATSLPVATKPGQWTQGTATTSESVWDMGQRLMQEIGWRMFVGPHPKTGEDVVYLVPDEWLFNRAAAATISENDGAVDTIDWTIDDLRKTSPAAPNRKPMDSCTVHAFDTWNVQPGSLVRVAEDSPADGKWLVLSWERDAVKPDSTIELGAPVAPPQPPQATSTTTTPLPGDAASGTPSRPRQFPVGTALVQPIPDGPWSAAIIGGVHDTAGLAGYPALDFGAIAGAPVIAVENGSIERFSGHDPSISPLRIAGVHGPYAWSIYLRGDSGTDYYYTHLGSRLVVVGQRVLAGQQIATVANYAQWGGANHTHVGVHPGPNGRPDIHDLGAAPHAARA